MSIAGVSTNFPTTVTATTSMQKTTTPPPQSLSWEDMEYGGLSLLPGLPAFVTVKNTFIDCPNLRSSSLDEYAENHGWKSCPASGIMMELEKQKPSEIQSQVISELDTSSGSGSDDHHSVSDSTSSAERHAELEDEKELGELPRGTVVKNTFIDYPTVRSASLDEYVQDRGWKSCPVSRMHSEAENQVSEIQAAVIREAAESLSAWSDREEEEEEEQEAEKPDSTTLRLLDHLPSLRPAPPVFSVGSVPHQLGQLCKPCGFVHKPEGCGNGANCLYCHLCPPGTIKQRKKVKKVMIRQVWNQQQRFQRRPGAWY